jgi:hypothetical protein
LCGRRIKLRLNICSFLLFGTNKYLNYNLNCSSENIKRFFVKDETIITYLSYLRGLELPELKEEDVF